MAGELQSCSKSQFYAKWLKLKVECILYTSQTLPPQKDEESPESIMLARYPKPKADWQDNDAELMMEDCLKVVRSIRSIRANYNVTAKQKTDAHVQCKDSALASRLRTGAHHISTLASCSSVRVLDGNESLSQRCGVQVIDYTTAVSVELQGVVNAEQEVTKLDKRIDSLQRQIGSLQGKIGKDSYKESTPEHVKQADNDKLNRLQNEIVSTEATRADFANLLKSDETS
jgi:valyl-tRNA synthetase